MKLIILSSFLFCASLAHADDTLLIEKVSGGGFTAPEWLSSESCRVYTDKVVIEKTFGAQKPQTALKYQVAIKLQGIAETIQLAKTEKVTEVPNNLCDAPVSNVRFFEKGTENLLFESGGCGTPRRKREGAYSYRLQSIVDGFCEKTF